MKREKIFRLSQRDKRMNKYKKILLSQNFTGDLDKIASKMAVTPHPNKCQCCCNIRRSNWYSLDEKLTLQERRNNIDFMEERNEK